MKIGLEVELRCCDDTDYLDIASRNNLSLNGFTNIDGLKIKMSEEYYAQTCEFNFFPEERSDNYLKQVEGYIRDRVTKDDLSLSYDMPQCVGTHIHFFDEEMLSVNKAKLLKRVLHFISENLDGLEKKSLLRLWFSHHIWANWDRSNSGKWRNFIQSMECSPYYYESASSRAKYRPIISSPESISGKVKSLEIRCIPNEYVLNGKLNELLTEIENGTIYDRPPMKVVEFFKVVARKYYKNSDSRLRIIDRVNSNGIEVIVDDLQMFSGVDMSRFNSEWAILSNGTATGAREGWQATYYNNLELEAISEDQAIPESHQYHYTGNGIAYNDSEVCYSKCGMLLLATNGFINSITLSQLKELFESYGSLSLSKVIERAEYYRGDDFKLIDLLHSYQEADDLELLRLKTTTVIVNR